MHHKRKRPKSARAGCLMCKPHKANGCCVRAKNMLHGNRRRYEAGTSQLRCEGLPKRLPLESEINLQRGV
jgi:hypothetical protein